MSLATLVEDWIWHDRYPVEAKNDTNHQQGNRQNSAGNPYNVIHLRLGTMQHMSRKATNHQPYDQQYHFIYDHIQYPNTEIC